MTVSTTVKKMKVPKMISLKVAKAPKMQQVAKKDFPSYQNAQDITFQNLLKRAQTGI
jgi:uncharacterized protein YdbL (DUF1318 family)